jgi:hypothetical protein
MEVCETIEEKFEETYEETVESWVEEVREVCKDLPWPLDWFCKAVTFLVKIITVIVKTVVRVFIKVVCYPVMVVLNLAAALINLILTIPFLGTLLKTYLGLLAWVWSQFVGLTDAGLGLIGIRPIKNLRLHIIILMRSDRTLTVPPGAIVKAVERTEAIFRDRADVKITTTVHQVRTPSVVNALYVDSGAGMFAEDMGDAGMYFQSTIRDLLYEHNLLFTIKIGAPIVAFVVDGVGASDEGGCSSGPAADYICIEGGLLLTPSVNSPVTGTMTSAPGATVNQASAGLAHEIGHACGLLHDNQLDEAAGDPTNLMFWIADSTTGDNLSPFQRAIIRSSPHVTYL